MLTSMRIIHNSPIRATLNLREYAKKVLHFPTVTVWCSFTVFFVVGPFFFEECYPKSGFKPCTVTTKRHLSLLREKVVPALQTRGVLPSVNFMQNSVIPLAASSVKTFLLRMSSKDRVTSRGCKIKWPLTVNRLDSCSFFAVGLFKVADVPVRLF